MNQVTNLTDLAVEINTENENLRGHVKNSFESALRLGELLTQAKNLVEHGEWTQWIENNCTVSLYQSRAYMRLYEGREKLGIENGVGPVLSINGALRLLTADSNEDEPNFINAILGKTKSQISATSTPRRKTPKPVIHSEEDSIPLRSASQLISRYCEKSYDSGEQRKQVYEVMKVIKEMVDQFMKKYGYTKESTSYKPAEDKPGEAI